MTEEEFLANLPAFPHEHRTGMTLRDYFAAKAMQGWIGATTKTYTHGNEHHVDIVAIDQIAKNAYAQADSMLKARDA